MTSRSGRFFEWLSGHFAAMGSGASARLKPGGGPDRALCAMVLLLTAVGVVMVFSAGAAFAAKKYDDWTYLLKREVIYAAIGLFGFAVALRTDYSRYRRWAYPLLFVTVALLAAVLLVGTRVNNASRWFRLGPLSFQPSELAKLSLPLYLSLLLARKTEDVKTFTKGFLPPVLVTGLVVGLIVLQPDLGTTVILATVALAMMFVSGARMRYLFLAVLATAPVVWKVLITGKEWRMKRLLSFLDPWQYCRDFGYQLCESLISVGSGGIFGQGLGAGRQKLFFLPEAHTDFILAIIGEELGLVGTLALLLVFAVLILRGLLAALRARDLFGSYLAFGITAIIALQALANMAIVMGLLPTKGLTLPFVSYGGTSLVVSLFLAGILGNISARNPEPHPAAVLRAIKRKRAVAKNRRQVRGPRIVVELSPRPAPAGAAPSADARTERDLVSPTPDP